MQENDGSKAPQAADGGLLERLEKIKESGLQKIAESTLPDQLQLVRANLLGRKGELTDILKSVGQAAPELRKAHQENDKAVIAAYGWNWRGLSESECVARLMKLYQQISSQT